jgi:hypothetical protein
MNRAGHTRASVGYGANASNVTLTWEAGADCRVRKASTMPRQVSEHALLIPPSAEYGAALPLEGTSDAPSSIADDYRARLDAVSGDHAV